MNKRILLVLSCICTMATISKAQVQRLESKDSSLVRMDSIHIMQSPDNSIVDTLKADIDSSLVDVGSPDLFEIESDTIVYVRPATPAFWVSWRHSYPLQSPNTVAMTEARADSANHSELYLKLDSIEYNPSLKYAQRDLRMPIVLGTQVPSKDKHSLGVGVLDEQSKPAVSHDFVTIDNIFQRQLDYGDVRYRAVFDYSIHHLNAVSMLRPDHYDLPTERKRIERQELTGDEQVDTGLPLELEPSGLNIEQVTFHADKWHRRGTTDLQISQTQLSDNWSGGENNITISNYDKLVFSRFDESMRSSFDIMLELRLSGYYSKTDTEHPLRVNDNTFRIEMSYGYKAWKNLFWSTSAYMLTPIFKEYKANSKVVKKSFFSPMDLNISFGMDLKQTKKKSYRYSLMLAPLSYNVKYVRDDSVSVTSFGIKENRRSLHEFGSSVTGKLEWKMSDVVSWTSRVHFFTSYHNTKLEFENTFNLTLGRYSTAKVYLYPRFDDRVDENLQMKEMLTFGLAFNW